MKKNCLVQLLLVLLPFTCLAETATSTTPMRCDTHFSKDTAVIEPTLLLQWATAAALQSFHFNPTTLETELLTLKPCYTDLGWQGFNDAWKKSGNIDAIKSKQLTVSSQPDGKATFEAIKDKNNQWKVSLPIQVTYQNKQQKIIQRLTVDLTISRQASGDLGIMQLIAVPTHVNP